MALYKVTVKSSTEYEVEADDPAEAEDAVLAGRGKELGVFIRDIDCWG
ncbi:MAG: hypothetical protein LC650_00670 [Actinobacteria bacterium]|nr:hypothetical protein [Actinomycetota bacterium]